MAATRLGSGTFRLLDGVPQAPDEGGRARGAGHLHPRLRARARLLRPILLLSEGAQRVSAQGPPTSTCRCARTPASWPTSPARSTTTGTAACAREPRPAWPGPRARWPAATSSWSRPGRFRAQAITDALTGLFNRRHFEATLDEQIERASAESWPLSLLLLDLDHFKQYNDRWGHTEGDSGAAPGGRAGQRTVRSTDIAFRYGGELAVLLPSCAKDQAVGVAEKVRQAVGSGTSAPPLRGAHDRLGRRGDVPGGRARRARSRGHGGRGALPGEGTGGRDRVVAAGGPSGGGPMGDERAAG